MGVETVKAMAIRTALSGPAASVIAAARIASAAGYDNVITCNMGGTSLDVSLVADGKSSLSAQIQIDFGMVIRTPMIEISTIGAGGGSVAISIAAACWRLGRRAPVPTPVRSPMASAMTGPRSPTPIWCWDGSI